MRYHITNNSKAPRGFHTVDGSLIFIKPGSTKTLDVADGQRLHGKDFLEVEVADKLPPVPNKLAAKVAKPAKAGSEAVEIPHGVPEPAKIELKALRAAYKKATGKNPFNGWDAATLREKIAAA